MYKTIGIIGCGVIGSVMKSWLLLNTKHAVKIYDPAKGYLDNIDSCDIYFIQIHIPTERNGKQNLKTLKSIIAKLSSYKPVFIRTPILPGTTEKLRREFHKDIYFRTGWIIWILGQMLSKRHTGFFTPKQTLRLREIIKTSY